MAAWAPIPVALARTLNKAWPTILKSDFGSNRLLSSSSELWYSGFSPYWETLAASLHSSKLWIFYPSFQVPWARFLLFHSLLLSYCCWESPTCYPVWFAGRPRPLLQSSADLRAFFLWQLMSIEYGLMEAGRQERIHGTRSVVVFAPSMESSSQNNLV